jgi:hypothetical protein
MPGTKRRESFFPRDELSAIARSDLLWERPMKKERNTQGSKPTANGRKKQNWNLYHSPALPAVNVSQPDGFG